jgi:Protein of unknown function (DUF1203)
MSENRQTTRPRRLSLSHMAITTSSRAQSATFYVKALSPERLETIKRSGIDDGGNRVLSTRTAEGGEPVRCCLHIAQPGERLLLIAYHPFTKPSPYAETGPVFVHADSCDGYPCSDRYPDEFRGRQQVFRCYDAGGNILGGHLAEPTEEVETVIEDLFADQEVEYIHTRNVVFGCYMLEIRRQAR